jgi:ceramide glucosyltransferase
VQQDYPEYQIVFGVRDPGNLRSQSLKKLIADFPDRDIALVISDKVIGRTE